MKLQSYKILFRLFSYLSDKTNGARFFVQYKMLLGTIIIGLTGTSCTQKKSESQVECYTLILPPETKDSIASETDDTLGEPDVQIDCYVSVMPSDETDQSTKSSTKDAKDIILIPPAIDNITEIPLIMCYDPVSPPDSVVDPPPVPGIMDYGQVDTPPVPKEGDLANFAARVQNNLNYPDKMLLNKVEGKTIVNFIIDTEGKLTDIQIVRSISPEADEEVIRILSTANLWTPGKHRGVKVKTKVVIPVNFRLPNN